MADNSYIKVLADKEMAESLRLRFWAVRAVLLKAREEMEEHLEKHFNFIRKCGQDGRIFASGPLLGEGGAQVGDGLLIFRGESRNEIENLLQNDPLYVKKIRSYEIFEWQVNVGKIEVSVDIYKSRGSLS